MQRVAIFKSMRGRHFFLLFIFLLSTIVGSLSLGGNAVQAETATTYKTESADFTRKMKALKYYDFLVYCAKEGRFKTAIEGGDIERGPRWWINDNGNPYLQLGKILDTWGNKDGQTKCNGEDDNAAGWISDMFQVFGLKSATGQMVTLRSIGYSCNKMDDGTKYKCTNDNINDATSKNGIVYKALHGPYLDGVNPSTEQPDRNAVFYKLAITALETNSMCNAQKGGSDHLVTISKVKPDGKIETGDWSIKNDGNAGRRESAGLDQFQGAGATYSSTYYSATTCGELAEATVNYAKNYVEWTGPQLCATNYPTMAGDQNLLYGCGKGWANQGNYILCATTDFNRNATISNNMKNACFIGQGLPADAGGISSGMLCYNMGFTVSATLTACIKGSLNLSDAGFCNTTYPPEEARDPKKAQREACIEGTKLAVAGGGLITDESVTDAAAGGGEGETSCGVEGIGWIVCPAIAFMGSLLESAFAGLADNFLKTDVGLFDTNSGTYLAWGTFRNFANIAFVIVFLIIIFSQLTGLGVTNYGVKKLLPRIVIAAILVNLSYFICQIAVDLSNVLGYSLKEVFDNIAVSANVPTSADASANGFGIASIIGIVIATATIAYFALSILIPILLGALIGVLMIVLMLIARKALIILLIVLSPLAFVAFLLPNTEPLFTKWRKAFMALLLLFPIVSVVFGLSSLASQIVLKAGTDTGSEVILQIMAVGIAALPLFVVPSLLKGALDGVGSIGGKLNGFASKMGGGLGAAGGRRFGGSSLGQFQQHRKGAAALRRAQTQSGTYQGKNGLRKIASGFNRKVNESKISGTFGNKALATGAALAEKESQELISNAGARLDSTLHGGRPLSQSQMMQIATGQNVTDSAGSVVAKASSFGTHDRMAAIQKAAKIATVPDAHSLVDASRNMGSGERKMLVSSLAGSGALAKAPYLGGKTLGDIEQGTASTRSASLDALASGKITAEALANGDVNSARELLEAAQSTAQGSNERKALKAAYDTLNAPGSQLREKIVAGGDHDTMLGGMRSL